MRFRRIKSAKELEIVSLIDVVFLLIIFGLVMSVYVSSGRDPGLEPPKTLRIELWRMSETDDQGKTETWTAARFVSAANSLIGDTVRFPSDEFLGRGALNDLEFERLDASRFIREQIDAYGASFAKQDLDDLTRSIYVVISPDTRLRIVNFIATECMRIRGQVSWLRLESK